jgi:REP-associated tyrosine transposase
LSVLNYNEIQNPRKRKGIIDFDRLMGLLGIENYDDLKEAHYKWVDSAMQTANCGKENKWTQSIAVGSKAFIEKMKESLGFRAKGRKMIGADDIYELREEITLYGKDDNPDSWNTFLWEQPPASLIGQFLHEI